MALTLDEIKDARRVFLKSARRLLSYQRRNAPLCMAVEELDLLHRMAMKLVRERMDAETRKRFEQWKQSQKGVVTQ